MLAQQISLTNNKTPQNPAAKEKLAYLKNASLNENLLYFNGIWSLCLPQVSQDKYLDGSFAQGLENLLVQTVRKNLQASDLFLEFMDHHFDSIYLIVSGQLLNKSQYEVFKECLILLQTKLFGLI